jgi:hypothetical protein
MSLKDKDGMTAKDLAKDREREEQASRYSNEEQRAEIADTLHLLIEVCILQTHKCFNDRHS